MSSLLKRLIGIGIILVIIGALAVPKIKPLFVDNSNDASDSMASSGPLKVEVSVVNPKKVKNKIFTTGTIRANEVVDLRSEASGKVTKIYFEEGQPVQKGLLLLKINDNELQAQLQRTQYQFQLASDRAARQKKLLEKGGISQEDYDETVNQVNVLRSEINLIKAQIDKTEVHAPFDGMIGLRYVSTGSYISPTTQIATLQNINPVKVDFYIPEKYANHVETGDKITFTVQGTNRQFAGKIYAVEPSIDTQTRTVHIRATSPNDEKLLVPGAFADLELILDEIDDALMVPSISLVPELNGQKVFVYEKGRVREQSVETGIRTEDSVQVVQGLHPSDTVLTTGLLQVRPGMPVQVDNL